MNIRNSALGLIAVLAGSATVHGEPGPGPADESALYPPRETLEASVERGRIAFDHYCVLCHGPTGEGDGRAARLYTPRPTNLVASDKNSAYKELIIRRGGAALGRSQFMPPWGEELTDEQITDIVSFLGSIASAPK